MKKEMRDAERYLLKELNDGLHMSWGDSEEDFVWNNRTSRQSHSLQ